jgi:hypothetical protein|tara:strand:+ start:201 stop:350 length:150 start_codon:yes stop_codon:yes gene_type:complete
MNDGIPSLKTTTARRRTEKKNNSKKKPSSFSNAGVVVQVREKKMKTFFV